MNLKFEILLANVIEIKMTQSCINSAVRTVIVAAFIICLQSCVSNKVSVVGIAKDDKGIATLISKKGQYFLEGVHHWEQQYIGKRVRVKGELLVIKYVPDTINPEGFSQVRKIDKKYLQKAKWKLIK